MRVAVNGIDKTVTVDGETVELPDFAWDADIRAISWDGAGGYIERHRGESCGFEDQRVVAPYVKAFSREKRRRDAAAKEQRAAEAKRQNEETAERETAAQADTERRRRQEEHDARARALAAAAYEARRRLGEADLVAIRCLKAGCPYPAEWRAYDEALRAIVRAAPAAIEAVVWPTPPTKPEGI
jgi:hypothetical protein